MEASDVFHWVHVRIAHTFLAAIPVDKGRTKHEVVQGLALTGGVIVEWDEENKEATLKGTWACMLQAQVVFSQYLLDLKTSNSSPPVSSAENEKNSSVICIPQDASKRILKNQQCSLTLQAALEEVVDVISKPEDQSLEENEVYVNITLSSLPFSILNSSEKNIISDLMLPPRKDCSDKPECKTDIKVSNFMKHSDAHRISESKNNCVEKPCLSDGADVNQKMLCDTVSIHSKSNSAHDTTDTARKHSSSNHFVKFNVDQIKEVSQFLKISNEIQVVTASKTTPQASDESKNELKASDHTEMLCMKKSEPAPEKDRYLAEIASGNTEQIAKIKSQNLPISGEINKYLEVQTLKGRENMKPVKSNSKKRKNYEELAPFKFFCSICSFKSKRESHYQRHLQLHNQVSQLYSCDKCSFRTIRLGHLRRHELAHSSTTLACNLCHYKTTNHKLLSKHKRIKHNTSQQVIEEKNEIFHCKHCEYTTGKNHFLQRHQRVHGVGSGIKSQRNYQCDQCQYKTSRREHLIRHTSNVHGGQRPFLCHRCGKAFKRPDALKLHATTHMTQVLVVCPVCGKGCRSQVHLTQHLAVHSTVRSFLCELCGSAFKTRAVQRKHILTIHQHPRAFFCHHCSRKFNTKYALRRHIKQHSSEKKSKSEEQASRLLTSVPGTASDVLSASMRMLQADAIFIQDPPRNQATITVQDNTGHIEGEKITVQLTETYDPEALRVIPSHSYVQHSNETATALLYLTGNFTPY